MFSWHIKPYFTAVGTPCVGLYPVIINVQLTITIYWAYSHPLHFRPPHLVWALFQQQKALQLSFSPNTCTTDALSSSRMSSSISASWASRTWWGAGCLVFGLKQ